MRLWLGVLGLMVAFLVACSGTGSSPSGPAVTPLPDDSTSLPLELAPYVQDTRPLPPGSYRVRLVVLFVLPIEPSLRETVLAYRDALQNPVELESETGGLPTEGLEGLTQPGRVVAPDGSAIFYTPVDGDNLTISLGDRLITGDDQGNFLLEVADGDPPTAEVLDPFGNPIVRLNLLELLEKGFLSQNGEPSELPLVQLINPCGMNNVVEFCGASQAKAQLTETTPGGPEGQILRHFDRERNYVQRELGTYPTLLESTHCITEDGPIKLQTNIPIIDIPVTYLFSTCDYQVRQGLCPFEDGRDPSTIITLLRAANLALTRLAGGAGGISGAEQDRLLADFDKYVSVPLSNSMGYEFSPRAHCYQVHAGRTCDQIVRDDFSVNAGGQLKSLLTTNQDQELTVDVTPGQPLEFTIHFNGGKPFSQVTRTDRELGGQLTGQPGDLSAGGRLLFFDPVKFAAWESKITNELPPADTGIPQVDQTLTYTAPNGAQSGRRDSFRFRGDRHSITVHFVANSQAQAGWTIPMTFTHTRTDPGFSGQLVQQFTFDLPLTAELEDNGTILKVSLSSAPGKEVTFNAFGSESDPSRTLSWTTGSVTTLALSDTFGAPNSVQVIPAIASDKMSLGLFLSGSTTNKQNDTLSGASDVPAILSTALLFAGVNQPVQLALDSNGNVQADSLTNVSGAHTYTLSWGKADLMR